jgi:hypothetical protein
MLDLGYKKLIGYETRTKGFEWFGTSPAHESLSAYGLLEFTDMNKVFPVNPAILQRTQQWLLDQRSSDGFQRNQRQLDSFGRAPKAITNAYIVWSLTAAGLDCSLLVDQLKELEKEAANSDDPYLLSLIAGSFFQCQDPSRGNEIAKRIAQKQQLNGSVTGAMTSITSSTGESLTIETTAIAILTWLNNYSEFAFQIEKGIEWIFSNSKAGRFGSTQATVLALKAIIAYDQYRARPEDGKQQQQQQQQQTIVFSLSSTSPLFFC